VEQQAAALLARRADSAVSTWGTGSYIKTIAPGLMLKSVQLEILVPLHAVPHYSNGAQQQLPP
jgi:hypothetical protein